MDENSYESILTVDVYHDSKNSSITIVPKSGEIQCEKVNFNLKDYIEDTILYNYNELPSPKSIENANEEDSLSSKLTGNFIL
jgi:hypothetical protein